MKSFIHVVKKYTVFKGRAGREEFWAFFLINVLICSALPIVIMYLSDIYIKNTNGEGLEMADGIADMLLLFLFLVFLISITTMAVTVRRLHDVNISGEIAFIPLALTVFIFFSVVMGQGGLILFLLLLTLATSIWLFVLLSKKGTEGPNKYGPAPKRPEPAPSPAENEASSNP